MVSAVIIGARLPCWGVLLRAPLRITQEAHNDRICKEARTEWVQGHILALPFNDRYTGRSLHW
jgi:hypothetical protein